MSWSRRRARFIQTLAYVAVVPIKTMIALGLLIIGALRSMVMMPVNGDGRVVGTA